MNKELNLWLAKVAEVARALGLDVRIGTKVMTIRLDKKERSLRERQKSPQQAQKNMC